MNEEGVSGKSAASGSAVDQRLINIGIAGNNVVESYAAGCVARCKIYEAQVPATLDARRPVENNVSKRTATAWERDIQSDRMGYKRIISKVEHAGVTCVRQSEKPDRGNLGIAVVLIVPVGAVKQAEKSVVVHLQDGPAAVHHERNILRGNVPLRVFHDPGLRRGKAHMRQSQAPPRPEGDKQSPERGVAINFTACQNPIICSVNTARSG